MPIVIDRNTGDVISSQKLDAQHSQNAWEIILQAYLKKHPEELLDKK